MNRKLTGIDKLLLNLDQAVRTLVPGTTRASRSNPGGQSHSDSAAVLATPQRRHIAGLMRINHCGEVCAQALYQGQAATARRPAVREAMENAASEEEDHLAWCEERLGQLGSNTSIFNPLFYAASFGIGAAAGLAGDKWSLGFVAATEQQVCKHLREHLQQIPPEDERSRAILQQMLSDEDRHATQALAAGGVDFPRPVKKAMTLLSRLMTASTYRI